MIKVVLDTNILVSALWSKQSNPFKIVKMFFENDIALYYSIEIIEEYQEVLSRDKLGFAGNEVLDLLREIMINGFLSESVKSSIMFNDESDRIFYDTAKSNEAILITGNKKHYPDEPFILSPAEFLSKFN
jgi:putative PIN family toxin of toxin-antitoxin system